MCPCCTADHRYRINHVVFLEKDLHIFDTWIYSDCVTGVTDEAGNQQILTFNPPEGKVPGCVG